MDEDKTCILTTKVLWSASKEIVLMSIADHRNQVTLIWLVRSATTHHTEREREEEGVEPEGSAGARKGAWRTHMELGCDGREGRHARGRRSWKAWWRHASAPTTAQLCSSSPSRPPRKRRRRRRRRQASPCQERCRRSSLPAPRSPRSCRRSWSAAPLDPRWYRSVTASIPPLASAAGEGMGSIHAAILIYFDFSVKQQIGEDRVWDGQRNIIHKSPNKTRSSRGIFLC